MATTYTDAQIRRDVLDEIQHDVRIDSTNVAITVQNGVVHLNGTVPTYFQKITAGEDAQRIKGVRDVKNDLVVTLVAPWTDQEIANTVRGNLARDVRIANPSAIGVSAVNGVVTLTGSVGTYAEKADATDDAWTAPGVIDVVNNLSVVPRFVRDDAEVANDVRAALRTDPAIDATNVQVSVVNGTVSLRGTVPTSYQVRRAANNAWGVPGVLNVVNELGVSF